MTLVEQPYADAAGAAAGVHVVRAGQQAVRLMVVEGRTMRIT